MNFMFENRHNNVDVLFIAAMCSSVTISEYSMALMFFAANAVIQLAYYVKSSAR